MNCIIPTIPRRCPHLNTIHLCIISIEEGFGINYFPILIKTLAARNLFTTHLRSSHLPIINRLKNIWHKKNRSIQYTKMSQNFHINMQAYWSLVPVRMIGTYKISKSCSLKAKRFLVCISRSKILSKEEEDPSGYCLINLLLLNFWICKKISKKFVKRRISRWWLCFKSLKFL